MWENFRCLFFGYDTIIIIIIPLSCVIYQRKRRKKNRWIHGNKDCRTKIEWRSDRAQNWKKKIRTEKREEKNWHEVNEVHDTTDAQYTKDEAKEDERSSNREKRTSPIRRSTDDRHKTKRQFFFFLSADALFSCRRFSFARLFCQVIFIFLCGEKKVRTEVHLGTSTHTHVHRRRARASNENSQYKMNCT